MRTIAKGGDLLFYKVTPKSSLRARLIAAFQYLRGEGYGYFSYSHVSILMENRNYQIEAVWPRIIVSQVDWSDDIEVCEIKGMERLRTEFVIAALLRVGDWYDLGQFLLGIFNFKKAEICTTLVRNCAAEVGISLAPDAGKLITPNELRECANIVAKM